MEYSILLRIKNKKNEIMESCSDAYLAMEELDKFIDQLMLKTDEGRFNQLKDWVLWDEFSDSFLTESFANADDAVLFLVDSQERDPYVEENSYSGQFNGVRVKLKPLALGWGQTVEVISRRKQEA